MTFVLLVFDEISYSYRAGRDVFRNLTCAFQPGRTVLLGPNGAGKSTLLAVGATVLAPRTGRVTFDGRPIQQGSGRRQYRREMAWMPQHVRPMAGLTIREQVAYVGWLKGMSKAESWREAKNALSQVGLDHRENELARALSGGQLRRVGIAQAVVHRARIVLMDEPTAGLDPAQRQVFTQLVSDLAESATVVVSTHQTEDLLESFDNVVVLDRGEVRFSGSVADYLALADSPDAPVGRQAALAYTHLVSES
ncbi:MULTISPECIES: ATP-binding cassette domain-containing protein [Parafrankia]|uniref:ATP-binding cassette domain-containing protein n=1 Tax=Parafrankia TaxID=2994362 RepID=UPI001D012848|nr:ATP-binding cassette domain-containing protein [Parafrankia sp. CH37]